MGPPVLSRNAQTNDRIVKTSTRLSSTLGILTGSLIFAGSLPAANVILNGSFEESNGPNGTNAGFGWVSANGFADVFDVYSHTSAVWYDGSAPAGAGEWYFHTVGLASIPNGAIVEQSITLSGFASSANIDAGNAAYDFSAQIAGYNVGGDTAILELVFLDAASSQVGSTVTLDGTPGETTASPTPGTSSLPPALSRPMPKPRECKFSRPPRGPPTATITTSISWHST